MPSKLRPPKTTMEHVVKWLGVDLSGDLGDWTIYRTRRGKIVFFPRSPPKEPASPKQIAQRLRFSTSMANWVATSATVKSQWEQVTLRLSVCATGHNLYLSCAMNPDRRQVASQLTRVLKLTGISLSAPTYVP